MGRNLEDNVYIEVPFSKTSPVLARLKEEVKQAQTSSKKKIALGPFIADLLTRRDSQLHGSDSSGDDWFQGMQVTPVSLKTIVEEAVRSALVGVTFSSQTSAVYEEVSEEEVINREAAELADAWGGEDNWDELEK
jgi:hypothetical protein